MNVQHWAQESVFYQAKWWNKVQPTKWSCLLQKSRPKIGVSSDFNLQLFIPSVSLDVFEINVHSPWDGRFAANRYDRKNFFTNTMSHVTEARSKSTHGTNTWKMFKLPASRNVIQVACVCERYPRLKADIYDDHFPWTGVSFFHLPLELWIKCYYIHRLGHDTSSKGGVPCQLNRASSFLGAQGNTQNEHIK